MSAYMSTVHTHMYTHVYTHTQQHTGLLWLCDIVGRRKIRSRLVNPTRASVNSEDVFVLVTPTELFQYVGTKANVLEKAKVTQINP